VRLELLERRHGSEERDVLGIEPGQDDVGEQRVQSRARRRDAAQRCNGVRLVLDIDEHELQPHRPAFDPLVHARRRVGVDPLTAARVEQRARLLQTEAEVRGIKRSELAVGEQVRGRERQPAARANDQVNVGRKIEGEVGQQLGADRLRQRVHVVEHERRRPCGVGEIAEQRGDRFAGLDGAAKCLLDRRCRRRPSQRGERAEQEGLDKAAGVVVLIEGEPCRAGAGR
jgi:hypothetical protein